MKYIHTYESFVNEATAINEDISYDGAYDVDFDSICQNIDGCKRITDEKEKISFAKDWLKKIKPVPLTGKIRTDVPALVANLIKTFKQYGIELDGRNVYVSSENFSNEIEIPVASKLSGEGQINFLTHLDYGEIAYSTSGKIGGSFQDENGLLDSVDPISDISNGREIASAASQLKQWFKTNDYE